MLAVARSSINLEPLSPTASSLTDTVMGRIRVAVHDGVLSPGILYSAYQLAEEFEVSRSPVREALLRLNEVGLVTFERNRGFRIVLPSSHEISEIFAIRLALELPAVRRVATDSHPGVNDQLRQEMDAMHASARMGDEVAFSAQDQRLHDLILAAAGNGRARAIVNDLRDATRLLGASSANRSRSLRDIYAEHSPVVDAIAAGEPVTAVRALRRHIVHTGILLARQATDDHAGPQRRPVGSAGG